SSPDTIKVTGTGSPIPVPMINLSAMTFDFGTVQVGHFVDTTVTITNTGTDTLKISNISANHPEFAARPTSVKIPPSGSVIDTLRFTPSAVSSFTGWFLVVSNASSSPDTIKVTGTGSPIPVPMINLSAMTFDFGTVQVGHFVDTTVTITNTGTDTLKISNISANHAEFAARPTLVNIPPSGSLVDTLRFTPSAVSSFTGWFLVVSNASSSPDTIKVTGIGSPTLDVLGSGNVPAVFMLNQNYPNPFNPSTNLEFTVPSSGRATLKIYNAIGQQVATLFDGIVDAGKFHIVKFSAEGGSASSLSSGIYFARLTFLTSNGEVQQMMKKMMLLK
ncbi:MAG: choice-of-anchor D domain-containing protein, partial [Bacteroidota bacterium]|nr:choice-of-anchor D domain-containing protein [Bacteroidota bacterium]